MINITDKPADNPSSGQLENEANIELLRNNLKSSRKMGANMTSDAAAGEKMPLLSQEGSFY